MSKQFLLKGLLMMLGLLPACEPGVQPGPQGGPALGSHDCTRVPGTIAKGTGDAGGGPAGEPGQLLRVKFTSPFLQTEELDLAGQIQPYGPFMEFPDSRVQGESFIYREYCLPPSATSVLITAHARGDGGANAYSCSENPCGNRELRDVGLLQVDTGGSPLRSMPVPNGLGCGCNLVFSLQSPQ